MPDHDGFRHPLGGRTVTGPQRGLADDPGWPGADKGKYAKI